MAMCRITNQPQKNHVAWLVFILWAGADYHLGNVCMQSTLRVGIFRTQVREKKKNLGVCIVVRRLLAFA
jgi:hypothetical protein